jgi:hypothetical protein
MQAGPDPVAGALTDAAARGDTAALAGLLPPLGPKPPQAALDAALLAAARAGAGWYGEPATRSDEFDAAAALLLAAGAAVGAVDEDGCTPLHLAALSGNAPLVRRLLAAGARVDEPAGMHSDCMKAHHLAAGQTLTTVIVCPCGQWPLVGAKWGPYGSSAAQGPCLRRTVGGPIQPGAARQARRPDHRAISPHCIAASMYSKMPLDTQAL